MRWRSVVRGTRNYDVSRPLRRFVRHHRRHDMDRVEAAMFRSAWCRTCAEAQVQWLDGGRTLLPLRCHFCGTLTRVEFPVETADCRTCEHQLFDEAVSR